MPTTLADIAKALGVSKMTVSRAINDHPEISPETRARILDAAQRMNYRPNQFARALTTNRSYLMGVVVPDLMHSYFAEICRGIESVAKPLGYQNLICSTDENIVQVQFAGIAAIHGRVRTTLDSRCTRIEQKQADTAFVTIAASGTCRHEDQPGTVPGDYHRFTPVEPPPPVLGVGAGAYIVQLVMAGRLVHGHRQLHLSAGNSRQQFVALFITA